jgi:hypothetical protein
VSDIVAPIGISSRSSTCALSLPLLLLVVTIDSFANESRPVTLRGVETLSGVGAAQGLEWRDGKLYLYGDADVGVIHELDISTSPPRFTGREIRLTADGRDRVPHPTGLTFHPDYGTFLGNTVAQKGTILHVDWEKMLEVGTLDGAVTNATDDDLAANGTRPEFVRIAERWLVATSDYGDRNNEVRLYHPEALARAARTSEPGVLAHRFSCGPWVQSLHWIDERGLLVLVQNQIEGLRWRLTFVDLERSVDESRAVVVATQDFEPADELEGFHTASATRAFFVSSSERDNFRPADLHWDALGPH